jgi:PadR family transcriptional regulator PadR
MSTSRRITRQTERILEFMTADPTAEVCGADIESATKIKKGTVYPALARMAGFGWLEWRWEEIDPTHEGRPRKRLYKLTGEGERAAHEIAANSQVRARERDLKRARLKPAPGATI